jgi:hypothetical protein
MHINATVIIQILNFMIIHVILSKFLLRPIANRILKKRRVQQELAAGLKEKEVLMQELAIKKAAKLLDFQKHVVKTYAAPIVTLAPLPMLTEPLFDESTVQQIANQAAQVIIDKASHE